MRLSLSIRQAYRDTTARESVKAKRNATFTVHYEAHREQVYRYLYGRTGNKEDAHDLTAQTFLAAYKNYTQYNADAPFLHWVMGIAHNKCVDFYRQKREVVALDTIAPPMHPAPLPEDAVDKQMQLEQVAHALQTLSEARQEVIALRLFAGMSNSEIADIMNKTPQAVAVLVHRALQDLKAQLSEGGNT
ncbi:MAG: sigma-70 family RNA polymerase sigma factor [Chloroflexota bacterium]